MTQSSPDLIQVTFEVPDRLVGQVYMAVGLALMRRRDREVADDSPPELREWGDAYPHSDDEVALEAWRKFSPRAQAVFSVLMDNPGEALPADELAAKIGLANGRHSLAGVVAWPSRQCAEMGLVPPFRYDGPASPGETGSYWMDPETARIFITAREAFQVAKGEVKSRA